MKVVQIVGCPLHSGAGRGIRALHEALLGRGIDTRIIGRVESDLPSHLKAEASSFLARLPVSLRNRLKRWQIKRRFGPLPINFQPITHGLNLHKWPTYREADLIHIQFAGATTIGPPLWRALKAETRPVVWTLRDMWPFTGGCHFSGQCERFSSGCGCCPELGGALDEGITPHDLAFKAAHIGKNITFVAISDSIAERARSSAVLKDRDIRVIPNSVMLDRFQPIAKAEARAALGLPNDRIVMAAGALNLANPRKGSATLAALFEAYRGDQRVHFAIFGQNLEQLVSPVPENFTQFGLLDDDVKLNRIYAAADLYLMPSLQESFGKVTVEAMASGTPVIAYDGTPAVDMVRNGETGWLVPNGDRAGFLDAVRQACALPNGALAEMGKRARADVVENFSLASVAERHIELYRERLGQQANPIRSRKVR
ncbi:MAG: glycosyltransferase [Mesorhizobium sp.]|uniref:glycosyltransferase n=1 Tax=Mesorhizobium sp. TaxID=1871066 RepID=UPI000FE6363C|nr:glycosyltransferase [Mesorhizobium sp.]RWL22674.1 MAG: glycosyltransferase [Mesorhizobium sp.]